MIRIKEIIISASAPDITNVLWADVSNGLSIKIFTNGKWEIASSLSLDNLIKLNALGDGFTNNWKKDVEDADLAMIKSLLLKQNKLTAGEGIEIKPIQEDDTLKTIISSKGRVGKIITFEDTIEFDSNLGLPSEQGWEEQITGDAIITNVIVENKPFTELTDSTNGGKADIVKRMTNDDFTNLLTYGGSFYGTSKLDPLHGNEGFWAGLQNNQSYRFGLQFRNEGGYLQVLGIGGSQVVNPITTFNGEEGTQTIWFSDIFDWEVVIPSNDDPTVEYLSINSGELFINKQPTGILVDYVAGGGIGETGCYLSSMSTGGDNHVSYHSNFGYNINKLDLDIKEDDISTIDDVTIITPEGAIDLAIRFNNNIIGKKLGNTITIVANNVGGNIDIIGNSTFLINGNTSLDLSIDKVIKYEAINTKKGGNQYSMPV